MNEHSYHTTVPPVSEGTARPLWSVMIPAYNSAGYLRATLASVLAQDPGPELMQVAVIDDHSTQDDPQAVVEDVGRGRVEFYRQSQNVGNVRNFNTCLQRSRGHLVHLLHSDDCVRPGFYRTMQQLFEAHPGIGAAFCRHMTMDTEGHWQWIAPLQRPETGVLENWLERIVTKLPPVQPPAMVVRREVYERLGGFDQRIVCAGEDWEMWVRIAAHYAVAYEVEPLALYREHAGALTGRCASTGQNVRDVRRIIGMIQSYLPDTVADELVKNAKKNFAVHYALYLAHEMLARGDTTAALVQIREALKTSRSLRVIRRSARLAVRAGLMSMRRTKHAGVSNGTV